jgi:hypothetical protein
MPRAGIAKEPFEFGRTLGGTSDLHGDLLKVVVLKQ